LRAYDAVIGDEVGKLGGVAFLNASLNRLITQRYRDARVLSRDEDAFRRAAAYPVDSSSRCDRRAFDSLIDLGRSA
jgi:hypothetical protein